MENNKNEINTNTESENVTEIVAKSTSSKKANVSFVTLECRCGNRLNAVEANGDTVKCPKCETDIKY